MFRKKKKVRTGILRRPTMRKGRYYCGHKISEAVPHPGKVKTVKCKNTPELCHTVRVTPSKEKPSSQQSLGY